MQASFVRQVPMSSVKPLAPAAGAQAARGQSPNVTAKGVGNGLDAWVAGCGRGAPLPAAHLRLADAMAVPSRSVVTKTQGPRLSPAAEQLLARIAIGRTCFDLEDKSRDHVMGLFRQLAALPSGLKLLQLVTKHMRHVDIIYNPKQSPHTHPGINGHTGKPDPLCSVIEMRKQKIKVYNEKKELSVIPEYLVLAHEILHAYHGARWPQLETQLAAEQVPDYSNLEEYASINGFTKEQAEVISKALGGKVPTQTVLEYGAISENSLRAEAGLQARWGHGGVEVPENVRPTGQPPKQPIELWDILMGQWRVGEMAA